MTHPVAVLGLCLAATIASAAPVPQSRPDPTKDRDGNPLPKGATARLGSLAFRGPTMQGLTFSADGKQLFANRTWELFSWDAITGRPLKTRSLAPADKKAGAGVVVVNDRVFAYNNIPRQPGKTNPVGTVTVFNLAAGRELAQFPCDGHISYFHGIAMSDDARYITLISTARKAVDVYETDTGKKLHAQKIDDTYLGRCRISPDNKTLYVIQAKKAVQRYELISGKALPDLEGTEGISNTGTLDVSPDAKRVVTCASTPWKDASGQVVGVGREDFLVVRDAVANKTIGKLAIGAIPEEYGFAGSNAIIVLGMKYRPPLSSVVTLSRWNLDTLRREWESPGPVLHHPFLGMAISPDGKRFVITDTECAAYLYDATTGKPVVESSGHSGSIAWVGFSANGELVTTVGEDGIRTWTLKGERKSVTSLPELTRGRLHASQLREQLIWVSYSEDGKKAELVGWDRARGEIGWRIPIDVLEPVHVLSIDGKRVALVSRNKQPQILDVTIFDGPTGKKLHAWSFKPDQLNSGGLGPMTLSPDGETLYVGGHGIAAFDVKSGKVNSRIDVGEVERVEPYSNTPLALSPDGGRIAIATRNTRGRSQTLRVYDVKTSKAIVEHDLGEVDKPGLRFSPSGKHVAVWDVRGPTVQVCDAESSLTQPQKLEVEGFRASCAAFSPNSANLVVGFLDGTALVWDLTTK